MRFGSWYPLAAAGDLTPVGEGVLQLRLAHGLRDYPTGKSAMVWYEHAAELRAAALAWAAANGARDILCRHLIELDPAIELAAFCARLSQDFVRRFGTLPTHAVPRPDPTGAPQEPPP